MNNIDIYKYSNKFDQIILYNEKNTFNALGMITTNYRLNEQVLTFLDDEKYINQLFENQAISMCIMDRILYEKYKGKIDFTVLITKHPKLTFYEFHNFLENNQLYLPTFDSVISSSAFIARTAVISKYNVVIGENVIIEDGVVIHKNVEISDNTIIRSGTILGSNAFQNYRYKNKVITAKSSGRLLIGKNVEIQHNCTVDIGVFGGETIISDYVKIDNLCYIAHDDKIGAKTFIAAGSKISGRVSIGENCWLGIGAIVSNGIVVGDNVRISLGAVVTKNVASNKTVSGNFAIEHEKFIEFIKSIR